MTTGHGARFAVVKFRPPTLPPTLVTRPVLHDRLTAGAHKRLTMVVGSAGTGKSVLLSSWAAARPAGATAWLSCDKADANPVRFWTGFAEAPRGLAPDFGVDAAHLLEMEGAVSADVTASLANDAARLPAGSAIIVDDFRAAATVATSMIDLVERWPADHVQLVLASRSDPSLRLHRMRMADELCELRNSDLYFSRAESHDLLAKFGVEVTADELSLLHQRSEGWVVALQMAALSLRGTRDPMRAALALDIRGHTIAEYFISEVLEQQPPEVVQFMLDTSVLSVLTEAACAAVTGRQDASALLHVIDAANLFVVPLDGDRTSFRYHHLVHRTLQAELRARGRERERELMLRAAEWFESTGEARIAARYFLGANQADRAMVLLQDHVITEFLQNPAMPAPLDPSTIEPALLADAPDKLLALAADLLLGGDRARGGQYLDLLEQMTPPIPAGSRLAARFAAMRSFLYAQNGQLDKAVEAALTAQAIQDRSQDADEWSAAVPLVLMRAYNCLEDFPAVEREAATALAMPDLSEPARLVMIPGARAVAWFEAGYLTEAADAAAAADQQAQRLGFTDHFFVVDYTRVLAGLALERRDLDAADQLIERVLSITEGREPLLEFLARLDRAKIWAARGHVREALASIESARLILAGAGSALLRQADELEALMRLSLGDLRTPAELASTLPPGRRGLLLARVALAAGNYQAARRQLLPSGCGDLPPRRALEREILLAAGAIHDGDPMTPSILGEVLRTARRGGFCRTVVTTAPQVTSYLMEHYPQARGDPYLERLIGVAMEARATEPVPAGSRAGPVEPLTAAELRILELLPTSSYLQIAAALYISRNTVKTHLRSIYSKLGVTSRSEAIERAVDLRLLPRRDNHPPMGDDTRIPPNQGGGNHGPSDLGGST